MVGNIFASHEANFVSLSQVHTVCSGAIEYTVDCMIVLLCRTFQVVLWINQNFLLLEEIEAVNGQLDVAFQSLRTQSPLIIRMQQNGDVCD